MGVLSLFIGIVRLFFNYTILTSEFDKMQIPLSVKIVCYTLFHVKLVWRLSEFAFLCVCFGRRIFYLSSVTTLFDKVTTTTQPAKEEIPRRVVWLNYYLRYIFPWVGVSAVYVNFKVAVRAGTVSGASHFCNLLALCNFLPDGNKNL